MISSIEPLLALLQLSDSAIPIGGYSHSWGLETWVQNEVITDAETALEAIRVLLANSIATQDGIACGCAHRYCENKEPEKLHALNEYLTAGKWSLETYQASIKMGYRLLRLAVETNFVESLSESDNSLQRAFGGETESSELHHSVVFGWLAASAGVSRSAAVSAYLQNSASSLISACVRLIPLGHTDGQKMIVSLRPFLKQLAEENSDREIAELTSFAPLHEAASFAHESLYSRLFQS